MKTPIFESSQGALQALLLTKQWVDCDLYTFFLKSGIVLQYATGTIDVRYQAIGSWTTKGPLVTSTGRCHWNVGLNVDTWPVTLTPRKVDPLTNDPKPDMIGDVPMLQAIKGGVLDGAEVRVDRAFFAEWPAAGSLFAVPTGVITLFYGRVGEVEVGRVSASFNVNSHLELLTTMIPHNFYETTCRHTLFDAGCQLNASSFAFTGGIIRAINNTSNFLTNLVGPSNNYFGLGRLVFTSGKNRGVPCMIRLSDLSGNFQLLNPPPFEVAVGDTFTAHPGCDKTRPTCSGKFNNEINYGGTPYVPVAETAL